MDDDEHKIIRFKCWIVRNKFKFMQMEPNSPKNIQFFMCGVKTNLSMCCLHLTYILFSGWQDKSTTFGLMPEKIWINLKEH